MFCLQTTCAIGHQLTKHWAEGDIALRALKGRHRRDRRHGRLWKRHNTAFRSTSYYIRTEKNRTRRGLVAKRTAGDRCDAENAFRYRQSIWSAISTGPRLDPWPLPLLSLQRGRALRASRVR
ncbi:hypothetical protein CI238_05407, partial [Colletotrichum incanum]